MLEIEGYDSIEELMEAVLSDAVSPAICMNEDCDLTQEDHVPAHCALSVEGLFSHS